MQIFYTEKAPAPVGPYSQAIGSGNLIFTSGQLPIDSSGIIRGDVAQQTEQAVRNAIAVLGGAGSDVGHVIKVNCYLADMNDFSRFNEVYAKFFTSKPARTVVQSSALPKGALVEIDVVAEIIG